MATTSSIQNFSKSMFMNVFTLTVQFIVTQSDDSCEITQENDLSQYHHRLGSKMNLNSNFWAEESDAAENHICVEFSMNLYKFCVYIPP